MSLTVQMKNDYSSVITRSLQKQGTSNSADMNGLTKTMLGQGGDNTLTDYAAIKNGSYGKLMKAYYSEVVDSDTEKTKTTSKKDNDKEKDDNPKSMSYDEAKEKINSMADTVSSMFNQYI